MRKTRLRVFKSSAPARPPGAGLPNAKDAVVDRKRFAVIFYKAMSAVEKIKVVAAKLDADEQYELFRWWVESDAFRQRQLAALKREIAVGVGQLAGGRYQTYQNRTTR